ncbi:lipocalin family protein [Lysobacter panacisoli]|uniref:Outer membrane lipoprotein Blc n=2 Tax=Lysobacter panacisoli TaxID=1255263 RepID=A0ABP9L2U7_9GAMM
MMHPRMCALALLLAFAVPGRAQDAVNAPVAELDLKRYSGQWHEIAHLPMFFQRQCVGDITATYTPRADGNVTVRNACRTKEGTTDVSEGIARPVAGKPAALEVRFAPDWLSWLPMVWADYWVIDLDPEYHWAVVGGPDRDHLWVLSREPEMNRALFQRIKARAAAKGYNLRELKVMAPLRP